MREKENSSPVGTLLLLLALLFIIIALIVALRSCGKDEAPPPLDTQETLAESPLPEFPDETSQPASPEPPAPTEAPTATPSPTPAPSPTPTPEPSPSSEPAPAAELTASGSFSSDTGTGLNIVVDWSAGKVEEGFVVMDVVLYVDSMSLNLSSIYNGATLTINGDKFTFTTPVLDIEGDGPSKSELCRTHIKLPYSEGGMSVPIEAVWNFNGSYSGVELKILSASGQADIP